MNPFLMLIAMIFLHIYTDFHLQGILASMKQKSWWTSQIGEKNIYKNDYRVALLAHAFEWAFVMMLPIFIKLLQGWTGGEIFFYFILVIFNVYFHYYVDNAKANKGEINLVIDQICHTFQIIFTWTLWLVIGGF